MILVGLSAAPASAQPTIVIDYSLDTNNFFGSAGSAQRIALETAAARLTARLSDSLSAITPGGGNTWTPQIFHPATGALFDLPANLSVAANEIRVYAGGRDLTGSTLGIGGPGGFSTAGGNQAWFDTLLARGQSGALLPTPTDFGPWGGSITFDSVGRNWNFSLSAPGQTQLDFLSVAEHELGHLLGFGIADSFDALCVGTTFTGPISTALNGGVNPSVTADHGHWANGTTYLGQPVAMSPSIMSGQRKEFTELDFGGLADLGWQVTPIPEPGTVLAVAAAGLVAFRRVRRR